MAPHRRRESANSLRSDSDDGEFRVEPHQCARDLSSAHPEFVTGQKMICPLEDFVAVLTWFVFMDPPTYKKACSAFTALRAGMMVEEFTKWAKIKADGHSFYNALELVIWLWTQKQR